MEKLIRNIDTESWQLIKTEAIKHNLKISQLLKLLILEHMRLENKKKGWNMILKRDKVLSDLEAKKIKDAVSEFEKSYDFED